MHLCISPYPAQYESRLHLAGVGDLSIRPIRPEDATLLVELFDTLSPRSVYYRFFSPMRQLSHAMLARFTQTDYDREIALVAILESGSMEKMLGAARVMLQHNLKDAEFAVLVGDAWQGRGIGAHLLRNCLKIAGERGFGRIWGTVLAENRNMLTLGTKLGFTIERAQQAGEFDLTLDMSRLEVRFS
jgi:acetyltransferase